MTPTHDEVLARREQAQELCDRIGGRTDRCEVCGGSIRDGLVVCAGLSPCWRIWDRRNAKREAPRPVRRAPTARDPQELETERILRDWGVQ